MQEVTPEMVRGAYNRVKEPHALLVTLDAPGVTLPLFTNWPDGIISRGYEYLYFPFRFTWGGASQEEPVRQAKLEIMNRDKRLAEAARLAVGTPTVTVELVRVAVPDIVEMTMKDAKIVDIEVDDPNVTGNIMPRSFKTEPACKARYVIARTPGLF